MIKQKGFAPIFIIIGLFLIGGISAGTYVYYKDYQKEKSREETLNKLSESSKQNTKNTEVQSEINVEKVANVVVDSSVSQNTPEVIKDVYKKAVVETSKTYLGALDERRKQADDEQSKSTLLSIRGNAEVYFDSNHSSYGPQVTGSSGCTTPGSMFMDQKSGVANWFTNFNTETKLICNVSADGKEYAIQASLFDGGYWCVGSGLQSAKMTSPLGSKTRCQ